MYIYIYILIIETVCHSYLLVCHTYVTRMWFPSVCPSNALFIAKSLNEFKSDHDKK